MKKQKVVRSYSPNCTRDAEELTEALKNGYQFVRASEFIPPQGNKVGYIEYILEKNEDSPEEEKLRQELKANRNVQEALRKELGEVIAEKESLEALIQTITNLPPAAPTQEWIPVSERTPEHGGEYLLWGKIIEDDEENYCFLGDYFELEKKFGIEVSNYDPHTLGFLDTDIDEYYSVIAWMPLPKPYEAESEGEDGN